MIITRTPFRISFFGGGTDYPVYYNEHEGAVLAATINRYCYISLRRLPQFFDYRYRIVWSKTELVREASEIVHPSVRECLRFMGVNEGMEIHHDGDLPAKSGLGSSSAFTVGMLKALYAHRGMMVSKQHLAEAAITVEQDWIKENVGSQDQTMAAFGGINVIRFNSIPDQHILVSPLCLRRSRAKRLENHLLLFFTGVSRIASEIAAEQIRITPQKKSELSRMHGMVDTATGILSGDGDLNDFGRMLHETWMLKRSLTDKISNSEIDELYDKARKNGALGGKLLGAGGGGFILFFARPEDHDRIKKALGLLHVPFEFEYMGSQIIYYNPMDMD